MLSVDAADAERALRPAAAHLVNHDTVRRTGCTTCCAGMPPTGPGWTEAGRAAAGSAASAVRVWYLLTAFHAVSQLEPDRHPSPTCPSPAR